MSIVSVPIDQAIETEKVDYTKKNILKIINTEDINYDTIVTFSQIINKIYPIQNIKQKMNSTFKSNVKVKLKKQVNDKELNKKINTFVDKVFKKLKFIHPFYIYISNFTNLSSKRDTFIILIRPHIDKKDNVEEINEFIITYVNLFEIIIKCLIHEPFISVNINILDYIAFRYIYNTITFTFNSFSKMFDYFIIILNIIDECVYKKYLNKYDIIPNNLKLININELLYNRALNSEGITGADLANKLIKEYTTVESKLIEEIITKKLQDNFYDTFELLNINYDSIVNLLAFELIFKDYVDFMKLSEEDVNSIVDIMNTKAFTQINT